MVFESIQRLSPADLRRLRLIAEVWVDESFWDDPTIIWYRAMGLVDREGGRIRLTAKGKLVGVASV